MVRLEKVTRSHFFHIQCDCVFVPPECAKSARNISGREKMPGFKTNQNSSIAFLIPGICESNVLVDWTNIAVVYMEGFANQYN